MLQLSRFAAMAAVAVGAMACDDDDDDGGVSPPVPTTFTVTIENVSSNGTLAVTRLNGVVPLSPGIFAVFTGSNPLWTAGDSLPAPEGVERLAEDGDNTVEATRIAGLTFLEAQGTFEAAGGADNSPLIFPGESATFTVTGSPGDRLQIETMFAQSNDWFFAFSGAGLDLFTGSTPVEGDVSSRIVLLDAGTEADEPLGEGVNQATSQPAPDTGPADPDSTIRLVVPDSVNGLPPLTSIIRVTVTRTP